MEGTLAVVTTWAPDFAPKNWAYCNGQLLAIAQNQALFSLVGTTYGGNGVNTFALPNLQSRTAIGTGQGQGLPNYTLGQVGGMETATLTVNNMPAHTHDGNINLTPRGNNTSGGDESPADAVPGTLTNAYSATPTASAFMKAPNLVSTNIGITGSGMPFQIMAPYLVVNYIICMYGIYPSRN